ncbi:unnamed protein product, partial [Ectocarpus sp. 8 AP-2014]
KFEVQKLYTLNQVRKCLALHGRVALAKSIFIYMAENDVSGVRRLMSQARRDGLSLSGIMHRLEQAVNGKYSAKGFSEDEFDLAILSMRLGGQSALHALHKAAGFPGATTVYAKIRERSMKFVMCASLEKECLVAAITANLERFSRLYDGEKRVVILAIDEIATEPRARYYGLTDEVLGLCVQHTPANSTKFVDLDNLEDLSSRLNEGHSHIGSEHTVISACALGDTPHHAIPVAAFASCKAPNPDQQQLVFETVRKCTIVSIVEVPGKLCLQFMKMLITRKVEASR